MFTNLHYSDRPSHHRGSTSRTNPTLKFMCLLETLAIQYANLHVTNIPTPIAKHSFRHEHTISINTSQISSGFRPWRRAIFSTCAINQVNSSSNVLVNNFIPPEIHKMHKY